MKLCGVQSLDGLPRTFRICKLDKAVAFTPLRSVQSYFCRKNYAKRAEVIMENLVCDHVLIQILQEMHYYLSLINLKAVVTDYQCPFRTHKHPTQAKAGAV